MFWWLVFALFLLIVVKLFPKAVYGIVLAAAVIAGGILFWNHYREEERSRIEIHVAYDRERCPVEKPLSVTITNKAELALERVSFSIHARLPGYSSVITPYSYKQYESDKILAPGEHFSECRSRPLMARDAANSIDNAALEWFATVDNVYLRSPRTTTP